MPFIDVQSNLPSSSFSEDFVKKLSSTVAAALAKPEDVSVSGCVTSRGAVEAMVGLSFSMFRLKVSLV